MEMIVYEVHFEDVIWAAMLPARLPPPQWPGVTFYAIAPWTLDGARRVVREVDALGAQGRSALREWNEGRPYDRESDPRSTTH